MRLHGEKFRYLTNSKNGPMAKAESRLAFSQAAQKTIARYEAEGVSPLFFAQVPKHKHEVLDLYRLFFDSKSESLRDLSLARAGRLRHQAFNRSVLDSVGARIKQFDDELCDEQHCAVGNADTSFYLADNHLTQAGSARLFRAVGQWVESS